MHCFCPYILWRRLVVCGLLCLMACQVATAGEQERLAVLARDPQWLAMLHMRRGLDGKYRSEVDSAEFFLSHRDDDAAAELQATVTALRTQLSGPYSAWCRFPARAWFVSAHLGVQRPAPLACEDLGYWRGRFATDELVLVYPEPYLKNIASVFGHTFLRFDGNDKRANPVLLSRAVSYYADVGSAGGTVSYIAKGLAGHFAGVIEIAPYFQKLRKYSDGEDRDIREYHLAFSPEQIRLLVDHLWEVRGHTFNYFFLDENCSYRLVAMMDVVTPSHRVREHFSIDAIPVDTIKVLQDSGLIRSSMYIPSARKRFYEQVAQLDDAQRAQLKSLVRGELHDDDVDDLRVLDLSANYNGMQMQVEPERRTSHALQVSKLVKRQYESGNVLSADAPGLQQPDPVTSGHNRTRLQTGWQHEEGEDFALFGMRAAYHDMHDPQTAYQRGVRLDVLDLVLRVAVDGNGDAGLEKMRWFGVQSYSPDDDFFREASWGFDIARQRELLGDERRLLHVAEGYRGVARTCGIVLCHTELVGGVLAGGPLDLGWSVRVGGRAGILYQGHTWSASAEASHEKYLVGEADHRTVLQAEVGHPLAVQTSLYASFRQEKNDTARREILTFSLRQFF